MKKALRPGVQGFYITCDGGRERQASHEAVNVIDSVCVQVPIFSFSYRLKKQAPCWKFSNIFVKNLNLFSAVKFSDYSFSLLTLFTFENAHKHGAQCTRYKIFNFGVADSFLELDGVPTKNAFWEERVSLLKVNASKHQEHRTVYLFSELFWELIKVRCMEFEFKILQKQNIFFIASVFNLRN